MTLRCVEDGLTSQLVVLPCNDPPAIHILDIDMSLDVTVSESQEFPIMQGLSTLIITLDQLDGAIGIQVCI